MWGNISCQRYRLIGSRWRRKEIRLKSFFMTNRRPKREVRSGPKPSLPPSRVLNLPLQPPLQDHRCRRQRPPNHLRPSHLQRHYLQPRLLPGSDLLFLQARASREWRRRSRQPLAVQHLHRRLFRGEGLIIRLPPRRKERGGIEEGVLSRGGISSYEKREVFFQ